MRVGETPSTAPSTISPPSTSNLSSSDASLLQLLQTFATLDILDEDKLPPEVCPICSELFPLPVFAEHVLQCIKVLDEEEARELEAIGERTAFKLALQEYSRIQPQPFSHQNQDSAMDDHARVKTGDTTMGDAMDMKSSGMSEKDMVIASQISGVSPSDGFDAAYRTPLCSDFGASSFASSSLSSALQPGLGSSGMDDTLDEDTIIAEQIRLFEQFEQARASKPRCERGASCDVVEARHFMLFSHPEVPCPICAYFYPMEEMDRHVSICLDTPEHMRFPPPQKPKPSQPSNRLPVAINGTRVSSSTSSSATFSTSAVVSTPILSSQNSSANGFSSLLGVSNAQGGFQTAASTAAPFGLQLGVDVGTFHIGKTSTPGRAPFHARGRDRDRDRRLRRISYASSSRDEREGNEEESDEDRIMRAKLLRSDSESDSEAEADAVIHSSSVFDTSIPEFAEGMRGSETMSSLSRTTSEGRKADHLSRSHSGLLTGAPGGVGGRNFQNLRQLGAIARHLVQKSGIGATSHGDKIDADVLDRLDGISSPSSSRRRQFTQAQSPVSLSAQFRGKAVGTGTIAPFNSPFNAHSSRAWDQQQSNGGSGSSSSSSSSTSRMPNGETSKGNRSESSGGGDDDEALLALLDTFKTLGFTRDALEKAHQEMTELAQTQAQAQQQQQQQQHQQPPHQ